MKATNRVIQQIVASSGEVAVFNDHGAPELVRIAVWAHVHEVLSIRKVKTTIAMIVGMVPQRFDSGAERLMFVDEDPDFVAYGAFDDGLDDWEVECREFHERKGDDEDE